MKTPTNPLAHRSIFLLLALILTILFFQAAFAASGDFILKWGSSGSGDGQFNAPYGVAVDSNGNVYVADTSNHRIQVFDHNGVFLRKWGSYGSGDGKFNSPRGVAVDSAGSIYVADYWNHRIQVFDSAGNFLRKFGDGSAMYFGVAVDSAGNVYTIDTNVARVQVFDTAGNLLRSWGDYGDETEQFDNPSGIAVDSEGNVYVVDTYNHRIQVFDNNGNFQYTWGSFSPEGADGQFVAPRGVALDSAGQVYVADSGNHRIQVFEKDGTFLRKWGENGSEDGQFNNPYGVTLGEGGNVYVADSDNDRIQKFEGERPELATNKSNDTSGAARVNTPFHWRVAVSNSEEEAFFGDGDAILRDELPLGPDYGTPMLASITNITNAENISCSIDGSNNLLCTASGGGVIIGAYTGSFEVIFSVVPRSEGTLENPRSGGICKADPDDVAGEDDELNNNCNSNSVTVAAPEIDVQGKNVSIPDGDTTPQAADDTDFGTAQDTETITHTFTISNTGGASLIFDGSPRVEILGLHATDFSVTEQPSATVDAGNVSTFKVVFDPTSTGTRSATVVIASDDSDENIYSFNIQGEATGNPIAVTRQYLPIVVIASDDNDENIYSFKIQGEATGNLNAVPRQYFETRSPGQKITGSLVALVWGASVGVVGFGGWQIWRTLSIHQTRHKSRSLMDSTASEDPHLN